MNEESFIKYVKQKKNRKKKTTCSKQRKMQARETTEVVFPKNWKDLAEEEQKEWIREHFMPRTKIPEPILRKDESVTKGLIRLESGARIRFPKDSVTVSKRNPNLVRELEGWVGKWLLTVFHDKSFPHIKYIGIANPSRSKWIAQELSSEIINAFYAIMLKIRWKYGFFNGKRRRTRKKSSIFTLSLKDNNRKGESS